MFTAETVQERVVHNNEVDSDERPFNDVKVSSVFGDV